MDTNVTSMMGTAVAGYLGYRLGVFVWERRKTRQATNKIIMLGNLYSDIAKWIGEEGTTLHPFEFEKVLNEKLCFVALAAKASE